MSVPNEPNDCISTNENPLNFSADKVRAMNHLAKIESGESKPKYGAVPNMVGKFSLLPMSMGKPGETRWSTSNDNALISVRAGSEFDLQTGEEKDLLLPGGGYANLILYSTFAQIRENAKRGEDPAVVNLMPTIEKFGEALGVSRGGKQKKLIVNAIKATLGASIQLVKAENETRGGVAGETQHMLRAHLADEFTLWVPDGTPLTGMEPSFIASRFMVQMALSEDSVPIRLDLLGILAGKPLAQQALMWLGRATYHLRMKGKPFTEYDWKYLYRNITHDAVRPDVFQKNWKRALDQAMNLYPEVRPFVSLSAPPSDMSADPRKRMIRISAGAPLLIEPKQIR